MSSQWSTMNDQWGLGFIILAGKFKFETSPLCKIHLVGCKSKLPPNDAPDLDVDLGTIKCGLIRYLDIRGICFYQYIPDERFSFLPKFRFIHIFFPQLGGVMQGKPHHVFIDTED